MLPQSLLCLVVKLLKYRFARCPLSIAIALLANTAFTSNPQTSAQETFTIHPSKFTLSFQTPTPGWRITPQTAYRVGDEIWCIHQLTPPEGMVAQVISKLDSSITLLLPSRNSNSTPIVHHYILGKTWNWSSQTQNIHFLKSLEDIAEQLKSATPLKIATFKE